VQAAPDAPLAPLDVPFSLVPNGVTSYALASPKLFLLDAPFDACPPHTPAAPKAPAPKAPALHDESIRRIAIQGSTIRTLYLQTGMACNTTNFTSNIVADADYIYFSTGNGLFKLSTNANPGDAPQLVNGLVQGSTQLAIDATDVYAMKYSGSNNYGTIYRYPKTSGISPEIFVTGAGPDAYAPQVSHSFSFFGGSGDYAYWVQGGTLHRLNLNSPYTLTNISASFIQSYYAEGGHTFSCGPICFGTSDLVYLSTGTEVYYYNNYNDALTPLYNTGGDTVYSIVTDDNNLFFLQEHVVSCGLLCNTYTDYVYRRGRGTSGTTDLLYDRVGSNRTLFNLTADGDYLMWQELDGISRLPKNASSLPQINLRTTGLEITQGIQKPDNSVRLIVDKRTFVRMFVKSDGPSVPGVTAALDGSSSTCGSLGTLSPSNPVGTNLTVLSSPQRANVNDSFLFELPWSWTECGSLSLTARLNPYHAPPQLSYANNDFSAGPFSFSPSPRLQVQFIAWPYVLFNQYFTPRFIQDILETFSWIRRAYPLNSTFGFSTDPSPGFRPNLWFVSDDTLGTKVQGTHPDCQDLLVLNPDNSVKSDKRNLCASRYTNQQMVSMRSENNLPDSLFFYGMIAEGKNTLGNTIFPRGQACCGTAVSTGPVGKDGAGGYFSWNGDGTYGDWYAAHEIGHTLGRQHPFKGSQEDTGVCGQSEKAGDGTEDRSYPYTNGQIGPNNNTEGFDAGDASLKQPFRVYPGAQWYDVMSYCANQWVSDYTYEGMYQYMTTSHLLSPATPSTPQAQNGDWLEVMGTIVSDTNKASINLIKHLTGTVTPPPLVPGGYSIRLVNASNTTLANYSMTPDALDDTNDMLTFAQIVTFSVGTSKVEIVRAAGNTVLTSFLVPAHAPVISNVALQGAPNPVTGTVTLGWTASDPDGLPLKFNVYYLRNGNPIPQPLIMNVVGSSTPVDTSLLGGGTARMRVVASDGFNTAHADSASFTMAPKPPVPIIDTPGTGLHVHWGQLVNFSGSAMDAQDGGVTGSGLVWNYQKGPFGVGPLLSSSSLPVGTNYITLTATNSFHLSASTSITVVVDDDLSLLNATLTAGPSPIGFSFPATATLPQTATLYLGNTGSGTLDWTASKSVPWLTLSSASGTITTGQASLVLTAHPSGIPADTSASGEVTLVGDPGGGQPTQTIKIKVNVVKGSPFDQPIVSEPTHLYMPVVTR
jgi:hypothetical protein